MTLALDGLPGALTGGRPRDPDGIERRNTQARRANGVPVDDTKLAQLREAATSVKVAVPEWL